MHFQRHYGTFTLCDTETNIFTDKLAHNPMGICVDVTLGAVWTPPHRSVQLIFIGICVGVGVGQCELTITGFTWFRNCWCSIIFLLLLMLSAVLLLRAVQFSCLWSRWLCLNVRWWWIYNFSHLVQSCLPVLGTRGRTMLCFRWKGTYFFRVWTVSMFHF